MDHWFLSFAKSTKSANRLLQVSTKILMYDLRFHICTKYRHTLRTICKYLVIAKQLKEMLKGKCKPTKQEKRQTTSNALQKRHRFQDILLLHFWCFCGVSNVDLIFYIFSSCLTNNCILSVTAFCPTSSTEKLHHLCKCAFVLPVRAFKCLPPFLRLLLFPRHYFSCCHCCFSCVCFWPHVVVIVRPCICRF